MRQIKTAFCLVIFEISLVFSKYCTNLPTGLNTQRKGVDITKLDLYPLSSGNGDNGFRKSVIDFTCDQTKTWKGFNIPDQIGNIADLSSGLVLDNIKIFKSSENVTESMASNVGISDVVGLFSASGSYKSMENTINNNGKYIEQVTSSLTTMTSDLEPFWVLRLSRAAEMFVQQYLKPSIDKDSVKKYQQFIRYYGTHIFDHAKFGGAIKVTLKTDKDYYKRHTEHHVTIQAKATFFGLIKLSGGHSSTNTNVDIQFKQSTKNTVRYYGGNTNLLSKTYGVDKWQPTVQNQPWLLGGRLIPIYELIQDSNKRKSMETAVQAYIDHIYLLEYSKKHQHQHYYRKYKTKVQQLLEEDIPNHDDVVALGKKLDKEYITQKPTPSPRRRRPNAIRSRRPNEVRRRGPTAVRLRRPNVVRSRRPNATRSSSRRSSSGVTSRRGSKTRRG